MAVLGSAESQAIARARQAGEPDPVRNLAAYLRGAYHAGAPLRLTGHRPERSGLGLNDRMLSRLEVASALSRLPEPERTVVEAWYVADCPRRSAAAVLGLTDKRMHDLGHRGLVLMVQMIYEWQPAPAAELVA